MRVALVSTKGGTGKTTSAVFLGLLLHRMGRTLAVDADPQGSLMSWAGRADEAARPLPFPVISLPARDLHRRLADVGADYEHVVIDAPPGELGIIRAAVMAADVVIVPVSQTGLDLDRIRPTFELLADIEPVHPVSVGVLLTRVRRGTRARVAARELLGEFGYPILDAEIPLAELYAGAFGAAPAEPGEYEAVLTEIKAS